MQTPKSRPGALDVPKKPSPTAPRVARKLKTAGSDSDSHSSPNPGRQIPKERSPKADHHSPRNPATEKKKSSRVVELEAQLAQFQEELKRAKDELRSSEAWKRSAQLEAEEVKKRLTDMSAKLEETQMRLMELSGCDSSRIEELCKKSQDQDRMWLSEVEAAKRQQLITSDALSSALNEIQRLKIELGNASQSRHPESTHDGELSGVLELVEELKNELKHSRESEARTLEEVGRVKMLLEVVRTTEEELRAEHASAAESCKSIVVELEESKNRVKLLEELTGTLQAELVNSSKISTLPLNGEPQKLRTELNDLKHEAIRLRDALEAAEGRYEDQYIQSTMQVRNAYKLVEQARSESYLREVELEVKLKESTAELNELNSKLCQTEDSLQRFSCENKSLNQVAAKRDSELELALRKSKSVLHDLKTSMLDREIRLQSTIDENKTLKSKIATIEIDRSKEHDEAHASAEAARAAEQDALAKLGYLTEETDKSLTKAARVGQQLDAAQAASSEMETELRRLKVQSDQWRKAAEAAATMLSTEHVGKYVDRTASFNYNTIGGRLRSAYSEDYMDDYSPTKRNGSMLKRIGWLLKKGSK